MKKIGINIGISLLCALTIILFMGCDDEDYTSSAPVFEGFRISPARPQSGDSVVIEAVQGKKGSRLYRAVYEWTITFAGENTSATKTVIYDNEPANPQISYKIPENTSGVLNVSFTGTYHYSGTGVSANNGGSYNDPDSGRNGEIRLVQSGALLGKCKGSAQFTVRQK